MSNKKQFITLGLFVIVGACALIIIALWLSVGISSKTYYTYVTVFKDPVNGLNVNSNVFYNGVNVGKVTVISLDRQNPGHIHIEMSIESGTPITTDTYATLQAQGITGLSYIGLQTPQGSKSPIKLLEPKDDPPYPLIKSEPSLLTSITDQFKVVSKSIQRITSQVNKLLSDQNIEHISTIIDNTKAISNSLKQTSQKTEEIVNSVSEITSSFAKNNEKINSMIDNTTNAAKEFSKTAQKIQKLSTMLEEQTLPNINNMLIPQLSNTLNNFSTTADHFNQLIEKIDNNPTVLIRGQAQTQPGPGETQ